MSATAPQNLTLGQRIRWARKRAGLSHDRLGALVGTSRQHLIRLEKDVHRPRPEMLRRIAEATGQPLELFEDADDEEAAQVNHRDLLEALHGAIGVALGKTPGTQQSPPHTLIGTRDGLRPQGA